MPSVFCSSCGKGYRVTDEASGKKFKCKQCDAIVRVPGQAVPVAAPSVKPAVTVAKPAIIIAKPRKPTAPPPAPVAVAPAGFDDDFDSLAELETGGVVDNSIPFVGSVQTAKPVKATRATLNPKPAKRAGGGGFALGFRFSRFAISLIVGGVVLGIWSGKELMLASSASDTPHEISCAELSANGPGSNANVRVTDFVSMSNFIYLKSTTDGNWQTVWLPIVPPSAIKIPLGKTLIGSKKVVRKELVDSRDIHVLIKSHTVQSQADVSSAMNRDSVEGLVINKIEKLTEKERDLLRNSYPSMAVDDVYIVEEGRKPQGGNGTLGLLGAVVLVVCGLFLMFKPA